MATPSLFPELDPKPKRKTRRQYGLKDLHGEPPNPDEWNFAEDLRRGQSVETAVAGALERCGFDAVLPPKDYTVRDLDNQADLIVNQKMILEVKGRRFKFHGPWDYPYKTAFVGSTDRWCRRTIFPEAIVIVSEISGGMIGVWTDTKDQWLVEQQYDKYRKREIESWAVPRHLLVRWTTFVQELRLRIDG